MSTRLKHFHDIVIFSGTETSGTETNAEEMFNCNGELLKYSPFDGGWVEYSKKDNTTILSYAEVLKKINNEPICKQEEDD